MIGSSSFPFESIGYWLLLPRPPPAPPAPAAPLTSLLSPLLLQSIARPSNVRSPIANRARQSERGDATRRTDRRKGRRGRREEEEEEEEEGGGGVCAVCVCAGYWQSDRLSLYNPTPTCVRSEREEEEERQKVGAARRVREREGLRHCLCFPSVREREGRSRKGELSSLTL